MCKIVMVELVHLLYMLHLQLTVTHALSAHDIIICLWNTTVFSLEMKWPKNSVSFRKLSGNVALPETA